MATATKKSAKPTKAAKSPKTVAPKVTSTETETKMPIRATMVGKVVSDKMTKTIVVEVNRSVRHGQYKKTIVRSSRFKAHDEKNEAKTGDQVRIVSCRPLSRDKHWALQAILRRSGLLSTREIEVNV